MPADLAPFLNYGVLGLVVVAILTGLLWARPSVERVLAERDAHLASLTEERDRLIEEKARAEEQRDAAISIAQDKIVPLLTSFNATTQTLIPLLQELVRDDDRRR